MSTRTVTADRVQVGDTLVDADLEVWTVTAVETVDRYMESQQLRFTLRRQDDLGLVASSMFDAFYFADERVTLADDPEPPTWESQMWLKSGPNPNYRPR